MKRSVQLLFVLSIFFLLIWWAGGTDVLDSLRDFDVRYLLPLIALSFALIWVSCMKWRLFLRAQGQDAPLSTLMRLYIVGYFFNLFTPSFIGGDIARSYQLGKQIGKQSDAFVATFLERFTGLLAMVMLALGAVLFGASITAGMEYAVCLLALATLLVALVCFSERAARLALTVVQRGAKILPARFGGRIGVIAEKLFQAFSEARSHKVLMLWALLWGFAYHGFAVLNTYVAALAIGWTDPSLAGLFVATPLALIVGMVPLTPSGLGIQEGAFLFFLERVGATRSQGLLVGILLRVKTVAIGLVGGLILWRDLKVPKVGSNAPRA